MLCKRIIMMDFYKCYNPKYYGVRDNHLETLKHFTDLSFRDLYTAEHIAEHHFGDNYLDSKLVKIEEERICLLAELGHVFLYLIVSKLKNGIGQYLELISQLQVEYKGLVRTKEDGKIVVMGIYLIEDLIYRFEQIENYRFIFHLLAKTNSGFLMRDWDNNVEINISRISGLLETVEHFDFSKVEL